MKDETPREDKVIVYVMGLLEDSLARKEIKGGRFRLDAEGMKYYKQLVKEKFKPTKQEIEIAYTLLSSPPKEVFEAYQMLGKLKVEPLRIHIWIWVHIKRFFKTLLKK